MFTSAKMVPPPNAFGPMKLLHLEKRFYVLTEQTRTRQKPKNIFEKLWRLITIEATHTNLVFVSFILDTKFFHICVLQATRYLPKNV